VVRAARCKCRTPNIAKNSPFRHRRTSLSGYIFATKVRTDNRKKLAKQEYLLHMSPRSPRQYGELRLTSGLDRFGCLGDPCNFNGFASWQRYCTALYSSGRQPNFAALNRRRHLYSAGRPSRWALAHISGFICFNHITSMSTIF